MTIKSLGNMPFSDLFAMYNFAKEMSIKWHKLFLEAHSDVDIHYTRKVKEHYELTVEELREELVERFDMLFVMDDDLK